MMLRKHLFPWLVLIIGPLIMIAPVLFTGRALFWGTPFLQFVPWRVFTLESLILGQLPYWNPFSGLGAPLLANYQSAVFYPPNWLLLVFQAAGGVELHAWGQGLLVLLHWIFAAMGTALLLKRLGLSAVGQAVGGLAFSLSGYLVGRAGFLSMTSASAWLPWIVLAVDRLVIPPSSLNQSPLRLIRRLVELTFAQAMLLLSGHAQLAWYILVFAFAWGIFRGAAQAGFRRSWFAGAAFAGAGLLAGAMASIQLVPTWEYLRLTERASALNYAYTINYSFWPWRLLTFLAPDLFGNPASGDYWLKSYFYEDAVYIGLLPFILAIAATAANFFRKKSAPNSGILAFDRRLVIFLAVVILVSMAIAMGQFLPLFPFLYKFVPTFDMFQAPARFSLLAVFCLALLAGAGAHMWKKPQDRQLYWTRLLTAGGAAVGLGAGLAWLLMSGVRPTFIRAAALLGLWAVGAGILSLLKPSTETGRAHYWWSLAVTAWVMVDLWTAGWSLNPTVPPGFYSQAAAQARQLSALAGGHRIYMPTDLEEKIKFDEIFQVELYPGVEAIEDLALTVLPDSHMLASGLSSVNNFDPLTPARYQRWIEALEDFPDAEKKAWLAYMDVSLRAERKPGSNDVIWQTVTRSPARYWLAVCIVPSSSPEDAFTKTINLKPNSESDWAFLPVILEGWQASPDLDCTPVSADITEASRPANDHWLTVTTDQTAWLVESESMYPGWQAELDGELVPLYQANYLFRAVEVPPGTHTVRFFYQPSYAGLCVGITLLVSLTSIVAYILPGTLARGKLGSARFRQNH